MLNNFLMHKVKNYYQYHFLVLLRSCLIPAGKSMFSQHQVAFNNAKQDDWLLQHFKQLLEQQTHHCQNHEALCILLAKYSLFDPLLNCKLCFKAAFSHEFPIHNCESIFISIQNSVDVFIFLSSFYIIVYKWNWRLQRGFGLVLFCSSHEGLYLTCWKQLRTLGSMLLPPKAATSPSCRGIWIASCSRRPSCLWSHISVGPATSLKRSATSKDTISLHFHIHFFSSSNAAAQAFNFCIIVMATNGHCLIHKNLASSNLDL